MPAIENPLPNLAEATDAAAKIINLKAELFMLNQELKTVRQLKRAVLLGVALIFFNLLMFLTFYWIGMALYENGWSPLMLAFLSFLFLGGLTGFFVWAAMQVGKDPSTRRNNSHEARKTYQ